MIPTRMNPMGYKNGTAIIAYGALYDPSSSSPVCQRIVMNGNGVVSVDSSFNRKFAHETRRCIISNLGTRVINYYLDAEDSTKKDDGTNADLSGADGDVMVEFPITYWRTVTRSDGKIEYLISNRYFPGSSIHPFFKVGPGGSTIRKQYVGAYEATYSDASGNKIMTTETLSSPVSYDSTYKLRSLPGAKPATNVSIDNFRIAANNNNGAKLANSLFYQYMVFFLITDVCSFNSQAAVSIGYTYANWNYAFTRLSGRCNFGNGTGELLADAVQDAAVTWQTSNEAMKVIQFQYRGIENPWGHIWKFEEGIVKVDGGYYWTADSTKYTSSNYAANYTLKSHAWANTNDYVTAWNKESFFATAVSGSATTYMTDVFYIQSGVRVVIRGGPMVGTTFAGAGYVNTYNALTYAHAYAGARIAC